MKATNISFMVRCIGSVVALSSCAATYNPALKTDDTVALQGTLRSHVATLSRDIGERNCYRESGLTRAADWIERSFVASGYTVSRQRVEMTDAKFECAVASADNIIAEKRGVTDPEQIVIVGAHYDSKVATPGWHDHGPPLPDSPGTPGANDNGSGVAALLALAEALADRPASKTVRFVAFVNEEPPFFRDRNAMGSYVFARSCKERHEAIVGAVILDALGTYSPQPKAKRSRFAFLPTLVGLPDRSDYVAFLGNIGSRKFMRASAANFQRNSTMRLRTAAFPALSAKVAWSDDWSFWQQGYPAFTVTDTAYLRADHYHELSDTYEKLDYASFAAVVRGVEGLVEGALE